MILKNKFDIIWKIVKEGKSESFFLFVFILISALLEAVSYGMILPLLEVIVNPNSDSSYLKYITPLLEIFSWKYKFLIILMIFFILIILKNFFSILKVYKSSKYVNNLRETWSNKIMENYLKTQYNYILSNKQGVIINNIINEPINASKCMYLFIDFVSKLILAFSLLLVMLIVKWKVTMFTLSVIFLFIFISKKYTYKYSTNVGKKKLFLSQRLMAYGIENVSAIRQIKIFSLEKKVLQDFHDKLKSFTKLIIKFSVIKDLPKLTAEIFIALLIVIILIYVEYIKNINLYNTIPIIGLFVLVSQRLFPIGSQLYSQQMEILSLISSLELVYNLTKNNVNLEKTENGIIIDKITRDIEFKNLNFSYDKEQKLFENLSFTIPKGKITAIIGPSGSGKSTIIDLLVGIIKYQKGNILINGIDLNRINLGSWRKLIGYVSQDDFLFHTSIKENILIGNPTASEEEIIIAAKKAYADQFIQNLPQKYDTIIGDKGEKISGGERQRIAIARAIIKNPELYIFDEATSALDPLSEEMIKNSLREISKEKTVIIISHRLSTIEIADIIYLLNKGTISRLKSIQEIENYHFNNL